MQLKSINKIEKGNKRRMTKKNNNKYIMKYDQDYYIIQQKKYLIFLINFTF